MIVSIRVKSKENHQSKIVLISYNGVNSFQLIPKTTIAESDILTFSGGNQSYYKTYLVLNKTKISPKLLDDVLPQFRS